jgi:hypothetical protein
LWHAFQLRPATATEPAEDYLSTTWLEYFDEKVAPRLKQVVQVMRNCAMKLTAKTGLAVANVGKVHDCAAQCSVKIRVLHEPDPKNPAYVAIRGFRQEDQELLEMLAADAVVDTVMASLIDALPETTSPEGQ